MGYATIDRTARTLTRRRESRRRTAEMLTLLSQDRVWTDRCWQRHRLAWMAPSYRANLLAFLERHRLRLYLADQLRFHRDLYERAPYENEHQWFERQPLVRRLRTLAEGAAGTCRAPHSH